MPFEYKPQDRYQAPVDPKRCRAAVFDGIRSHQCRNRAKEDGWCRVHHPDVERKRREESDRRHAAQETVRAFPFKKARIIEDTLKNLLATFGDALCVLPPGAYKADAVAALERARDDLRPVAPDLAACVNEVLK